MALFVLGFLRAVLMERLDEIIVQGDGAQHTIDEAGRTFGGEVLRQFDRFVNRRAYRGCAPYRKLIQGDTQDVAVDHCQQVDREFFGALFDHMVKLCAEGINASNKGLRHPCGARRRFLHPQMARQYFQRVVSGDVKLVQGLQRDLSGNRAVAGIPGFGIGGAVV